MTDHEDLIRRLYTNAKALENGPYVSLKTTREEFSEAAAAIKELVADRDGLVKAVEAQMAEKHKERAEAKMWFEKAQEWKDDLAAARVALRYMVERDHPAAWLNYPNRYDAAIAAARAEGGE